MGEKTEKATPKKLQDARKKGQVARSQDLPAVVTFAASILAVLSLAPLIYRQLSAFFKQITEEIPTIHMGSRGPALMIQAVGIILLTTLPIVGAVAICGALANFFMIGPLVSFESMKFNLKKLNPIDNLKQKFKLKTLIELLKSVVKLTVAGYICYKITWSHIDLVIAALGQPLAVIVYIINYFLRQVLIQITLFFAAVALFDWFYQKRVFEKEMMMEKFEIKQEYKNMEGDPEIKWRRREIAREIAYGGATLSPQGAKAVITNPTHLAVAIGYDSSFVAPYILTKGSGSDAMWIIKKAQELDIPVMRNVPLARQLYETCDLFTYVPVDTYEAIAEILKWVDQLKSENDLNRREEE